MSAEALALSQARGAHGRVALADVLPLIEWCWAGEQAMFKIKDDPRRRGKVDLVAVVATTDSRYDSALPLKYGYGPDRNAETTDAEALVECEPDYATLGEALEQFRRVCRLLVLHEVDETLRFAGLLPFDPHTDAREREWPGTEALP